MDITKYDAQRLTYKEFFKLKFRPHEYTEYEKMVIGQLESLRSKFEKQKELFLKAEEGIHAKLIKERKK